MQRKFNQVELEKQRKKLEKHKNPLVTQTPVMAGIKCKNSSMSDNISLTSSMDGMSLGMGTPLLDHFNLLKPADQERPVEKPDIPRAPKVVKGLVDALNPATKDSQKSTTIDGLVFNKIACKKIPLDSKQKLSISSSLSLMNVP